MTGSVIVSGPPAVGKTTVARALGKKFGLEYVSGGDVLKEIASENGFDSGGDDWWDTEQGMKFLALRAGDDKYDIQVDERLKKTFYAGGAVMTSYTLPWLVKGGVKVWLAGSLENSAARMRVRDGIEAQEAAAVAKKRYDRNKVLYKRLYGFEFGADKKIFDVEINTDGMDAAGVIRMAEGRVGGLL